MPQMTLMEELDQYRFAPQIQELVDLLRMQVLNLEIQNAIKTTETILDFSDKNIS